MRADSQFLLGRGEAEVQVEKPGMPHQAQAETWAWNWLLFHIVLMDSVYFPGPHIPTYGYAANRLGDLEFYCFEKGKAVVSFVNLV